MKLSAKLATLAMVVVVMMLIAEVTEAHRRYRHYRHGYSHSNSHRIRRYRYSRYRVPAPPAPPVSPPTPAPVPVIPQSVIDFFNLLATLNLLLFSNLFANTLPPNPIVQVPLPRFRLRRDVEDECFGRELPEDIMGMLQDMKEGQMDLNGANSDFRCMVTVMCVSWGWIGG